MEAFFFAALGDMKLKEALSRFETHLLHERRLSENTALGYLADLRQLVDFLYFEAGVEDWPEVTTGHIRKWLVQKRKHGKTGSTLNRYRTSASTFFKYLVNREGLEKDVTEGIEAVPMISRLLRIPKQDELECVEDYIETDNSYEYARDVAMIALLYYTGMRRSELIELLCENIDWEALTVRVQGKRQKERVLPLSKPVADFMKTYLAERSKYQNGYFFLTLKGEKMYPKLVYLVVRKYLSLASNVERSGPHTMRHAFATHLLDNGAELVAVKELLGHSSLAATQVYTHNSIEKLKHVYNQAHPRSHKNDSL
jgi:integrase/recombinase XerC